MSDDRELLKLAAKAAGIKIDRSEAGGQHNDGFNILGNAVLDWHNDIVWNPLEYDGDALRLAVDLGIRAFYERNAPPELGFPRECGVAVVNNEWTAEANQGDPYAATRRAIVRAAAEIGKENERH